MAGTSTSIPKTLTDRYVLEHIINEITSMEKEREQLENSLSQDTISKEKREEVLDTISAITLLCNKLRKFDGVSEAINQENFSACCVSGCPFKERLRMNEYTVKEIIDPVKAQDKDRYLFVSVGNEVCCFDIKKSKDEPIEYCSGVRKVPSRVGDFKFPVVPSVFSLGLSTAGSGSNAYIVSRDGIPDLEVLKFHHLRMVDGCPSVSECSKTGPLKRPKPYTSWPIVDKIGNHLHVMEYLPWCDCFEICSHHVLNLSSGIKNRGWIELSPVKLPWEEVQGFNLINHIVVGQRFYFLNGFSCAFVVFDSETSKWEVYSDLPDHSNPFAIKHVAELLRLGFGRCIGEYVDGVYAVLAVAYEAGRGMIPLVYLVTSEGRVLCFQRLYELFEGFEEQIQYQSLGTVIECGEKQGKKLWAIVIQAFKTDTLHVASFTLKLVGDVLPFVSDLLRPDECPYLEEVDFINVAYKGWYVSQMGGDLELGPINACYI